jgi:CRP/FNR family transcriptional regulator
LATGEILFRPGEARAYVYRVESGVVCVCQSPWQGHRPSVEFCFPGDFVGLGFLDRQVSTARAAVDTVVSRLPFDRMNDVVSGDPLAEAKLSRAVENDFESIRNAYLRLPAMPIERVASLLVTMSRANAQEGRDPRSIMDSFKCGVIADYLAMSPDELAGILVELEERGLVTSDASGVLRLTDLAALEALADTTKPSEIEDEPVSEITDEELAEELERAPAFLRRRDGEPAR